MSFSNNSDPQKIVQICQRLYQKDWLAACDGNVSSRKADGTFWMTPTAKHKGFLKTEDLAEVDLENRIISGNPSGERLMHLAIYRNCPKAQAVVHAHPPIAIAWSVANPTLKELPSKSLSEVILAVGSIPIIPYARPGTQDMGDYLKPYLPEHRVLILARHGAVAWGEDLEEAYAGIERLEHSARILFYSKLLGGLTELSDHEVHELRKMRSLGNGKTL